MDLDGNNELPAVAHGTFVLFNAVSPNPATDLLVITSEVRMFMSSGRHGAAQELDVFNLSHGLYVVLINDVLSKITIQCLACHCFT